MRKFILAAALLFSFVVAAQTTEKTIQLARNNYDDFKSIQGRNLFKMFGTVPETATEVYAGTVLQYTRVDGSDCVWDIMPDGEYRFTRKLDGRKYYLRFVNGVLMGYSLSTNKKDGSVHYEYYKDKRFVDSDTIKSETK
jgi:hypothetical protein